MFVLIALYVIASILLILSHHFISEGRIEEKIILSPDVKKVSVDFTTCPTLTFNFTNIPEQSDRFGIVRAAVEHAKGYIKAKLSQERSEGQQPSLKQWRGDIITKM